MLADRFGGTPFAYWNADARQHGRLLELLGVEGEVAEAYRGMAPDDEVIFVDED